MENNPEAAGAAQAPQTEATPNTNQETGATTDAQASSAPDMHGFTSEQLADMQKFFQANGGYDKVKSRISNPTPAPAEEQKPVEPAQPIEPKQPEFKAPAGAINQNEYFVKRYFLDLAAEKKYANISEDIVNGKVLTEMADLGIQYMLPNGAIDGEKVNKFLTMKSETRPAKQSGSEPEASAAPTVDYIPVGDKIDSIDKARAIMMQDDQLRRSGQAGHPNVKMAEEYLKNLLSPDKK